MGYCNGMWINYSGLLQWNVVMENISYLRKEKLSM